MEGWQGRRARFRTRPVAWRRPTRSPDRGKRSMTDVRPARRTSSTPLVIDQDCLLPGPGLALLALVTKAHTVALPMGIAKQVRHNSEALALALAVAVVVEFARPGGCPQVARASWSRVVEVATAGLRLALGGYDPGRPPASRPSTSRSRRRRRRPSSSPHRDPCATRGWSPARRGRRGADERVEFVQAQSRRDGGVRRQHSTDRRRGRSCGPRQESPRRRGSGTCSRRLVGVMLFQRP